jgi:hypothetical protein
LALEAAVRRRAAKDGVVRLATVQRVTRAQRFAGGGLAHFSLFALVTAGRDPGGYAFEAAALSDQVAIHVQSVLSIGATEVRVLLTDLTNGERDAVLAAVEHRFAAAPLVSVVRDPERLEAGGYYQTARFKVRATFDGPEFEVSDGGFTAWTQRLLHDDRGERLCISGSGLDRLAEL